MRMRATDFKRIISTAIVLTLLSLAIGGCSGSPEVGTDGSGNESKVLTIATQYSIATLNPTKTSSDGDGYIIHQVMEPLVIGEPGDQKPLLAESWTNPDDLTWEFKLRENAYWHEGNEVYPDYR